LTSLAVQFILHLECNGHDFSAFGCYHYARRLLKTPSARPTRRKDDHHFNFFYVALHFLFLRFWNPDANFMLLRKSRYWRRWSRRRRRKI